MLDMNAPYGVEDRIAFANAVAPYDILWLEAPPALASSTG